MPQPRKADRKLVEDLWWFIENVSDTTPDRTDRFFALRKRVRDYYASRRLELAAGEFGAAVREGVPAKAAVKALEASLEAAGLI